VILALLALVGCSRDPDVVTLDVEPLRSAYRTDQQVLLTATVEPEGRVDFTASPEGAASFGQNGSARLLAPGEVTLQACSRGRRPGCAAITLTVDDGAPNLEVTTPAPGAQLDGPVIEVAGSVADRRDVNVFVNGQATALDELGRFTAAVEPAFGVVPIEVVASDGFAEPREVRFDVLWADGYRPAAVAGRPGVALDDGIVLALGANLFDDGVPVDPDADPVTTRDLADIVDLLLLETDLSAALPDPVVDQGPAFVLRIPDARVGASRTSADVTGDGIALTLHLDEVTVATEGQFDLAGVPLDLSGGIVASVSAYAHLTVRKPADGPAEASVDQVDVALNEVRGAFADPGVNAAFAVAASPLRTTLEAQLRTAVAATLEDTLPALLTGALGTLDGSLSDVSVPLEVPGLPPLTLALDGGLGAVTPVPRRAIEAELQTAFGVVTTSRFPDSRGYPHGAWTGQDSRLRSPPVQLALRLDLLNGALHALWDAGLLELDAGSLIPPEAAGFVQQATLNARIPPVLRPPRGASPWELVLDVGQLELDLTSLGVRSRFGVSLSAGVSLQLADDRLGLTLAEEPTVRTWLIEQDEADLVLVTETTIEELFTSSLWPSLRDGLAGGLAFDLPALDGLLGDLAPGLRLSYGLAGPVGIRDGAMVLDVEIVGTR